MSSSWFYSKIIKTCISAFYYINSEIYIFVTVRCRSLSIPHADVSYPLAHTHPLNGFFGVIYIYPGDPANIQCDNGYYRSGPPTRTCMLGGIWSEPPTACLPCNETNIIYLSNIPAFLF